MSDRDLCRAKIEAAIEEEGGYITDHCRELIDNLVEASFSDDSLQLIDPFEPEEC